jgi:hypothetical protein
VLEHPVHTAARELERPMNTTLKATSCREQVVGRPINCGLKKFWAGKGVSFGSMTKTSSPEAPLRTLANLHAELLLRSALVGQSDAVGLRANQRGEREHQHD